MLIGQKPYICVIDFPSNRWNYSSTPQGSVYRLHQMFAVYIANRQIRILYVCMVYANYIVQITRNVMLETAFL